MKISNKDRRVEHQIAIKLPITIISTSEEGWSEETTMEDVSAQGALCYLSHRVNLGERLKLKAKLPNGSAIELLGRIVHIATVSPTKNRVGVKVVGDSKMWEQFFLAWLTDERD
jgi:hypothetical protein